MTGQDEDQQDQQDQQNRGALSEDGSGRAGNSSDRKEQGQGSQPTTDQQDGGQQNSGQQDGRQSGSDGGQQDGRQTDKKQSDEQQEQEKFALDNRRVTLAGVGAAGLILLGLLFINISSGSDARSLLEALLPTIRALSGGIMTATTTILALMLTMLSMTKSGLDARFTSTYYSRVKQLATLDTVVFAVGLLLLLATSLPLTDAGAADIPENWYQYIYIGIMVITAAVGGGLLSVMLMLYNAITGVMRAVNPKKESQLTR